MSRVIRSLVLDQTHLDFQLAILSILEKHQNLRLVSLSPFLFVLEILQGFALTLRHEVVPVWPLSQSELHFRLVQKLADVLGVAEKIVHSYFIYEQVRLFIRRPIVICVVHLLLISLLYVLGVVLLTAGVDVALDDRVFLEVFLFGELMENLRDVDFPLVLLNPSVIDFEAGFVCVEFIMEIKVVIV